MNSNWRKSIPVVAAVAVLAVLFGVTRLLAVTLGVDVFGFLRPSIDDLLDGRKENQSRLAAVAKVDRLLEPGGPPGVEVLGRQVVTACVEGHNSIWEHQGFRLRCDARGHLFGAWSGAYEPGYRAVITELAGKCSGGADLSQGRPPSGDLSTPIFYLACDDGVSVSVRFANGAAVSTGGETSSVNPCGADCRVISGDSAEEIRSKAAAADWVVVLKYSVTYFKDLP
ncbi:hypothetical protein [Propionicimonas sp.]|uniref:hypothetical protein n=1 Tax=Propionicimonas sp. TaxID=1955623 RepID=UPI0017AE1207|nr:hypothetical protein [Propionicimonas sp.]MBU3975753.1 hypothetical protein [Actinomycetota bacterium]MBA3022255.1 hypothetical protein [Propionicimonas sp.]MBU3985475.1 hypothetical protein [Actinomycetota bacterium]MBU4006941.1 hypothetical protein [Actinomycetota bacterium]MBU4065357.1 hypothetical protein [Actinomycetota bacterium]